MSDSENEVYLGNYLNKYDKDNIQYKINIFKMLFDRIKDGSKTIDIIFNSDITINRGDTVMFKSKKDTIVKTIIGVAEYNNLEKALDSIDTKNLLRKTKAKAYEWYEKRFPDDYKKKLIIISW